MKQYNPINSVLCIIVMAIITNLVNFSSASTQVLGEKLTIANVLATIAFIALWMWQANVAGQAGSRRFGWFVAAYWLIGTGLILLVDVSMRTGIGVLGSIGFFGLLLVMVPTYAVIFVSALLRVDYMWNYPVIMLLILVFYWMGLRKYRKAATAAVVSEGAAPTDLPPQA